ncbi:hypothetical protein TIFTF001_012113 [Ficus carica]|uniref:diacylglycerol O-acyltransferase n=1 Tax=Ficus carica TaxID=3494 RepID=A0AA88ABR0_FICCA|nr:hypothetical protein TIFTF001_012113 [Ficus carica]
METDEGLKLRKQALKPILTKIPNGLSSDDEDEDPSDEEEEEERPLSPTGRLFHEPQMNLHVVSVVGCNCKIDPEVVKANFPLSFLKNYRFSSVLVRDEENGGKMKWVRTKVDLDKHIIVPEVDQLAHATCSSADKFVEDYVHNLTKTYLNDDLSRPLWDLHILNLKTSEADGTAILRVHHSLGDGISLMSVLLTCTRKSSDPKALATLQTNKSKNENNHPEIKRSGFVTKLLLFLIGIWWFLRLFFNTIIDLIVVTVSLCMCQDKGLPIKGRPSTKRTSRRIVFKNVSLDDLKLVKNTLNTVCNF